ncbi:aldehyde dehydrogenase [Hyphococcus sp.]|uniref:aldehyde dehydrogenase n=1 Tax=Hyphococcus sp. TaxID=2038636 RepID=UPI0035C74766
MSFAESVARAKGRVTIRTGAFINGAFRPSKSGETMACLTPIDGSELGQLSACDASDIDDAVAAARASFEAGHWRTMAPRAKRDVMLAFAQKIDDNAEELALLETLDMGKPLANTTRADIPLVAQAIRYYAEAIDKVNDELGPSPHNAVSMIVREPMGVVGAVVPWNFPLLMASWKFAPALATGNSIVVKPAEQASLTMLRTAELAMEAGLPEGVLNVVPGLGEKAGKALALHMDVDAIVFTGSTAVGKLIMGYGAQSNLKRVALECGGKSPQIVMEDCPDFEAAAQAAAWGVFYDQGQVCTAATRLLVQNSIKKDFLERVAAIAKDLKPGDPLDPDTSFGAMVDEAQMNTVLSYINKGEAEGAKLICGGERALGQSGGFYVAPTIFDGVDNKMTIAQEEIFGPVVSAIGFDDFEDAMRIGNDTIYGLAAGVWTSDIDKAHRAARTLRAGNVWVNCWDGSDITTPFGGFKQSGFGRDRSLHALDKYTELKTIWIELRK